MGSDRVERRWGTSVPLPLPFQPVEKIGPPMYKPGPREAQPYLPTPPGRKYPRYLDFQAESDPFDGRFRYPPDHKDALLKRQSTPLGLVIEMFAWCLKYQDEIFEIEAFEPIFNSVRECVHREIPDVYERIDNDYPQTPF